MRAPGQLVPLMLTSLVAACGTDDPTEPDSADETPAVASVQVTPSNAGLASFGQTVQLTATGLDSAGVEIAGKTFTWSSSDNGIATVSSSGLVAAVANGSVTITASSDGVDGLATVLVEQVVAAVSVTPEDTLLASVGETVMLTAAAQDANSNPILGQSFLWSSSDENVATVDADGVVSAVASGSATITATTGGVGGDASITVLIVAGSALRFDGANDYAEIPGNLRDTGITTAFTVSVWVKAPASGGMQMLLEDGTQFNTDAFYLGVRPDSDRIFARLNTLGGSVFNDNISVPPFADEWAHLALTYDGATFTAYFNAVAVYEPSITGQIQTGNRNLRIGYPSGENFYAGEVDELRVWNVSLTQAELQASMSSPLAGSEAGLVGYWRLDEGQGQSFADATVNALDGTLGSSAAQDVDDPSWRVSTAPITNE